MQIGSMEEVFLAKSRRVFQFCASLPERVELPAASFRQFLRLIWPTASTEYVDMQCEQLHMLSAPVHWPDMKHWLAQRLPLAAGVAVSLLFLTQTGFKSAVLNICGSLPAVHLPRYFNGSAEGTASRCDVDPGMWMTADSCKHTNH